MLPEPADHQSAEQDAPAVNPRRPQFTRFRNRVRMPEEDARRQSQVVQKAWTVFGDRAAAMAFLNTHHDRLEGRPLDVATLSDEGLEAVERVLAEEFVAAQR